MFTGVMNLIDLTINQLKRATAIKERIEALNKELQGILGASAKSGASPKKRRTMSAAAKKRIAVAQKARWAKVRAKSATLPVKSAAKKAVKK
jgi:hypothetical protein